MTDNSEGSEPIKLTEKERIKKEAYLYAVDLPLNTNTDAAMRDYFAGATAEHQLLKPQLEYADSTIKKLHEAMVSAERRGHDKAMEEMKARDENGEDFEEKALLEIDRLNEEVKQRDETIKQLNEYKIQAYEQLTEIQQLKEALKELIPIIDFVVKENDLHLHFMDKDIIEKARKLIDL